MRHYYEGLETITKRSLEKTDTSQGVAETALRTGAPPGRQLHGLIALSGDKKEKRKKELAQHADWWRWPSEQVEADE